MKPFNFRIELEVYRAAVHVFFGHSDDEFDREFRKIFNQSGVEGFKSETGIFKLDCDAKVSHSGKYIVIRFGKSVLSDNIWDSLDCVAHESFHAAVKVLKECGCSMDDSSEEAYAYLTGYINNQIVRKLFDIKPKSKKK